MKSVYIKSIAIVVSVLLLTLTFQNCSPGFKVQEMSSTDAAFSQFPSVQLNFAATPEPMNASNASVAFSSTTSSADVVYKCSLNNSAPSVCTSPVSLAAAGEGDLVLKLTAETKSGQILSELSKTFRVDKTAPSLIVSLAPAATIAVTNASIQFTVADNLSSAAELITECALDAAEFAACSSPLNLMNLAMGAHVVKLRVKDKAQNIFNAPNVQFTVSLALPSVTISQAPAAFVRSGAVSFIFAGSSANSNITGYECSLDGAAFAACTSPQPYNLTANKVYEFSVRAKDALNQVSNVASAKFTLDTVAPAEPTLNPAAVATPNMNNSFTFSFTSSDANGIANYSCQLDAAAFEVCTSPKTFAGLASGNHAFKFRAVDVAGNVSGEKSITVAVDVDAPFLSITSKPDAVTTSTSASIAFSALDSVSGVKSTECKLDSEAVFGACTSPKAYANLAVGNRSVQVRATDNVGRVSTQTVSWIIQAGGGNSTGMSAGCGVAATGGYKRNQIAKAGGKDRTYHVLVPNNYMSNEPLPLIFGLHGNGGTGEDMYNGGYARNTQNAERAIYVYPQGIQWLNYGIGWNEMCNEYDMEFFTNMINDISKQYCVNPNRIFGYGYSWGAEMMYSLACCMGDKFRGVIPFSGPDFLTKTSACGTKFPAIRAFLGTADGIYNVNQLTNIQKTFANFAGCSGTPVKTVGKTCERMKNPNICTHEEYQGCKQEVSSTVVQGLGHTFPDTVNDIIWDFFKTLK